MEELAARSEWAVHPGGAAPREMQQAQPAARTRRAAAISAAPAATAKPAATPAVVTTLLVLAIPAVRARATREAWARATPAAAPAGARRAARVLAFRRSS